MKVDSGCLSNFRIKIFVTIREGKVIQNIISIKRLQERTVMPDRSNKSKREIRRYRETTRTIHNARLGPDSNRKAVVASFRVVAVSLTTTEYYKQDGCNKT